MRTHRFIGFILVAVLAIAALGPASVVAAPAAPAEGCTPTFWAKTANFDQWTKFKPSDKFKAVFKRNDFGNMSLLKVIRQSGTTKKNAGRHAVAGLLNATHPDVNYRVRNEQQTKPFEVKKFWRIWSYSEFLMNHKKANRQPCPLS